MQVSEYSILKIFNVPSVSWKSCTHNERLFFFLTWGRIKLAIVISFVVVVVRKGKERVFRANQQFTRNLNCIKSWNASTILNKWAAQGFPGGISQSSCKARVFVADYSFQPKTRQLRPILKPEQDWNFIWPTLSKLTLDQDFRKSSDIYELECFMFLLLQHKM